MNQAFTANAAAARVATQAAVTKKEENGNIELNKLITMTDVKIQEVINAGQYGIRTPVIYGFVLSLLEAHYKQRGFFVQPCKLPICLCEAIGGRNCNCNCLLIYWN
jgi:hypothetical protein